MFIVSPFLTFAPPLAKILMVAYKKPCVPSVPGLHTRVRAGLTGLEVFSGEDRGGRCWRQGSSNVLKQVSVSEIIARAAGYK